MRTAEYREYEDEPERKKAALYIVVALLILGLFGLMAWLLAGNLLGGGDPVKVPDVVGMQRDEAVTTLSDVDLNAAVVERPSKKPAGEVFKQDPEAGARATTGDDITIYVSSGLKQVTVPDVTGMTLDEAKAALKAANLKVGQVTEEAAPDAQPSEVLRQFPAADKEVDTGTEIDLVVAAGATVPDVTGMTEEEATTALEDAGYVVSVSSEPSNDVEEGIVIAQDPAAGTQYDSGQTVNILVSEGPQAQEMPDVTGQDGDTAQQQLEDDFGLNVTQVDADPSDCGAVPPGTVCVQDPDPGTPVSPGDSATLYVQPGSAFLIQNGLFAWVVGLLF
jgi:serine/threonine-protein kinase